MISHQQLFKRFCLLKCNRFGLVDLKTLEFLKILIQILFDKIFSISNKKFQFQIQNISNKIQNLFSHLFDADLNACALKRTLTKVVI